MFLDQGLGKGKGSMAVSLELSDIIVQVWGSDLLKQNREFASKE